MSAVAMMTNVLAGAYPDLFAAASSYSGVPFGCFAGPTDWNSQCAQGQLIKSAEDWVSNLFSLLLSLLILLDRAMKSGPHTQATPAHTQG
jgi:hypothetical protein